MIQHHNYFSRSKYNNYCPIFPVHANHNTTRKIHSPYQQYFTFLHKRKCTHITTHSTSITSIPKPNDMGSTLMTCHMLGSNLDFWRFFFFCIVNILKLLEVFVFNDKNFEEFYVSSVSHSGSFDSLTFKESF